MPTPAEIAETLTDLQVPKDELLRIRQMPFQEGVKALDALKGRIHTRVRRLAFELHPDRNENDSGKAVRLRRALEAAREFESLQLQPPQPPPAQRVVTWVFRQQQMPFHRQTATATGTATTVNMGHPSVRSFIIRF